MEPTMTTQLTAKPLKAALICWWLVAGIGMWIMVDCAAHPERADSNWWGQTAAYAWRIGIGGVIGTKFRIWWNHK